MQDSPTLIIADEFMAHYAESEKRFNKEMTFTHLDTIIARYREPWRKWHTEEHIADGLLKFLQVKEHLDCPFTVFWAWLYHDAVYAPGAPTNEHCSAELAKKELLKMGLDSRRLHEIVQIILATKGHKAPNSFEGSINDLSILLDVDMSSLGDPFEKFVRDGELLREEFGVFPDEVYNRERATFAEKTLSGGNIYQTVHFAHLEDQAQKNLRWAIAQAA